jgi:hypothetical protein
MSEQGANTGQELPDERIDAHAASQLQSAEASGHRGEVHKGGKAAHAQVGCGLHACTNRASSRQAGS